MEIEEYAADFGISSPTHPESAHQMDLHQIAFIGGKDSVVLLRKISLAASRFCAGHAYLIICKPHVTSPSEIHVDAK
jgi:hypothetical protein